MEHLLIHWLMVIADKLDLSSVSNMNALEPTLEMNLNININFPGIEKSILIHLNFFLLFVKMRLELLEEILYNIKIQGMEIFYPPQQVEDIAEICKEINDSLYQPGEEKVIKEEQVWKLGEYMIKLNSNNFSEIFQVFIKIYK